MEPIIQKFDATPSTAAPIKTDIHIPGYKILRELGHGGMAHVYLAIQESFGREVALKILSPHLTDDEQFSIRFLREARIVSQLNHPNIVTVFDAGKQGQYHYMSMEYIPGKDLKQLKGTLSRKDVIRVVKDVASALDFAGEKGIVHRDVKPENIMIHAGDKRVILMDFGIAHGDDISHGMTQTGKAIGTPHFMSPEQTKGSKVDHRSDIYSLGVVLYQLLAGRLPYDASSAVAVGIKHLTAPIPLLPAGLEIFQPVINSCLSKQPEHRYQKAAELIAALDKITDEQVEKIDSQAALFRQAGADHDSKTQVSNTASVAQQNQIPALVFPSSRKNSTSNEQTNKLTLTKRRRNLLLLLLLCTVAWAAIEKQQEIINYWGNTLMPEIVKAYPDLLPKSYLQSWQNNSVIAKSDTVKKNVTAAGQDNTTTRTTADAGLNTPLESQKSAQQEQKPLSIHDKIVLLKNGLNENPLNAIELATLYKQLLKQERRNPIAVQGLKQLHEWYAEKIQQTITTNDMKQAHYYLELMQQSFPRATKNNRFNQFEEKIARQDRINSHMENAEKYFNAGALSKPADKNALNEIKTVLKIAPGDEAALKFIDKIVNAYMDETSQLQAQGNIHNALLMVEEGIAATDNNAALIKKRAELKKISQYTNFITSSLRRADKYLESGSLISPQGRNAYELYQKVLEKNENNLQAKAGLKSVQQKLASRIIDMIREGKIVAAETQLQAAIQRYGKTPILANVSLKLNDAISARSPKVLTMRLSNTALKQLDVPDLETLQLKRTLYIGFNYANFETATSLLQASLYDGSEKVLIAQKPVIITDSKGEQFFDINLPVDGFKNGSYKIKLMLNDKILLSKSFLVKAIQPEQ